MSDLTRVTHELIESMNEKHNSNIPDPVRDFIEKVTFATPEDILSALRGALAEDWMAMPVWARNLAYRLVCLHHPDDAELLREAAADLLSFGPDWDEFAEDLKDRATQPRKGKTRTIHVTPWMHITTPGAGLNIDRLLPTSGSVHVARLNGKDMLDESSTFETFREKFAFPEYFGWNWHAFYDCLRDLQWHPSDYHILIIEAAEHALSDNDVAREELFRALHRAGRRWSYTKRPEGTTLSKFLIVLSCDEEAAPSVANNLAEIQKQA
ncbi:barstar family protein [Streptomyces sp. NPDC006175]|uniref:barstar family protein n=1 Tax=Streptomyces sp. NPDC006175 TaxID=3154471 RepID=UPI00339EB87E